MSILGNVENGWFAQVANACRGVSNWTLNVISGDGKWGDKLYSKMDGVVERQVQTVADDTYKAAIKAGKTPHQALALSSKKMEGIANPNSPGSFGDLLGIGFASSYKTAGALASEATAPNLLGSLVPLLIGVGVLGATYAAVSMLPD